LVSNPLVADLYRLDLGKPLTAELTDSSGGVNYRVFEHGLAAANWKATNANLTVESPPIPATWFYDVFAYDPSSAMPSAPNILVPPAGSLSIPAMSGRVYLFGSSTDFGLNRLV
jgi:hypothetical protein